HAFAGGTLTGLEGAETGDLDLASGIEFDGDDALTGLRREDGVDDFGGLGPGESGLGGELVGKFGFVHDIVLTRSGHIDKGFFTFDADSDDVAGVLTRPGAGSRAPDTAPRHALAVSQGQRRMSARGDGSVLRRDRTELDSAPPPPSPRASHGRRGP